MDNIIFANPSARDSNEGPKNREAYERLFPLFSAIAEPMTPNVDVTSATLIVCGALPKVEPYLEELSTLRHMDMAVIRSLEERARACRHAQTLYEVSIAPRRSQPELVESLTKRRDLLASDASAAAVRGLLDPTRLNERKMHPGQLGLSADVLFYVELLRSNLLKLTGKTAVTQADLDAAAEDAEELEALIAVRNQSPAVASEAQLNRARAFTYMAKGYNMLRRGICFLRWDEGDADIISPTFYTRSGGGSRKSGDSDEPQPETQTPAAGSPSPTTAASAKPAQTAPASPASGHPNVPVGMPGSNPFV